MNFQTINIIGAGRLGQTLGYLISQKTSLRLQAICNRRLACAVSAAHFIKAGAAVPHIADLPPADITLITTPDHHITSACEALVSSSQFKPQSLIVHCSGAFSSAILSAAQEKGCTVASAHPSMSFIDPYLSVQRHQNVYYAVEGDPSILDDLSTLLRCMGGIPLRISTEAKTCYHSACVFASNYAITLAHHASLCLQHAGIGADDGVNIIAQLMQSTVDNFQHTNTIAQALTGPLQRGDIHTIEAHLQTLPQALRSFYCSLGLKTLELTSLSPTQQQTLHALLSKNELSNP